MDQLIAKGIELINDAQKVLVFSGAGLSTESGIPDFRSPGGIWEKLWRKLTGRKDDKIMFSRQPAYAKASAFVEGLRRDKPAWQGRQDAKQDKGGLYEKTEMDPFNLNSFNFGYHRRDCPCPRK